MTTRSLFCKDDFRDQKPKALNLEFTMPVHE